MYVSSAKWKNLDGPVSRTRPSDPPPSTNSLPTASNFAILRRSFDWSQQFPPSVSIKLSYSLSFHSSWKGGIKKLRIGHISYVIKQRFVIKRAVTSATEKNVRRAHRFVPCRFQRRTPEIALLGSRGFRGFLRNVLSSIVRGVHRVPWI